MIEKGRLTVRQLGSLMFLCTIGEQIIVFPSMVTSYAHQDAWLSALLGVAGGAGILSIMLVVYKLQPRMNLIQHALHTLGPWIGAFISCFYLFYFLMGTSAFIREIGDFMTTQILPESPLFIVNLLFVFTLVWGLLSGLEPIGRSAEVFLPLIVLFLLILTVCLFPHSHLDNIKPILGEGFLNPFKGFVAVLTYPYCELCIFLMLFPYAKKEAHWEKDILLAAIIGGLMLTLTLTICLLVMGPFMTQHHWFAAFNLSLKINIGNFLQRIEALMASVWIIAVFFKSILFFYSFVLGITHLFKLSSYRPLILPCALLVLSMSIVLAPNENFYLKVVIPYWIDWDLTCGIAIPLLLIMVHKLRVRLRKS
ncbi:MULTISPECIES: GerAB/ArcD/ProY family transporter [unclassified Paenibacillus]|uniref:GerAB/ArcD/ProY family transporter n=1 Tax=unclassified Paenibacillus TaxID=185978 RepID=UPI0009C5F7F5|nr:MULTISPECIES: endospore germination permease [unclassified Paenibacillus]SLK03457.1 spore germination protein KB [Paenibacillus sp. RU5A]SOC69318.1 spore germination protein KB [Paenibacillus sp. RU26A]SOC71764.1 spore germination protein KB [Paenibacillus sp. RU5M]